MRKFILLSFLIFFGFLNLQAQENSLSFDGTNDYVSAALPEVFTNTSTNDFTIETWIKPQGSIFSRVLFAQLSDNNFVSVSLGSTNKLFLYVSNVKGMRTVNDLDLNTWSHIACTWDAAKQEIKIYINGVLQEIEDGGTSTTGTHNSLTIGCRTNQAQYFKGELDELRVWDKVRSQCEINLTMHTEFMAPQGNLVLSYSFNQGEAAEVNATVSNLNDLMTVHNGELNGFELDGTSSNWLSSGVSLTPINIETEALRVDSEYPSLTVNIENATYQWLDCDNNMEVIENETEQSFTPLTLNSYAAAVTLNGCSDTSDCVSVTPLSVNNTEMTNSITVSPNPMNEFVQVQLNGLKDVSIIVHASNGLEVYRAEGIQQASYNMNLDVPAGIYILEVNAENHQQQIRLVKN